MVLKVIKFNSKEYQQMVNLRYKLLREPLGLCFKAEQLAADEDDFLLGCFDQSEIELIGCCILGKVNHSTLQLRQMVVSTEFQGKGIGKIIIGYAEGVARNAGYSKLILHARKLAEEFYKKMGYSISGDEFIEVSIPHFSMEKTII